MEKTSIERVLETADRVEKNQNKVLKEYTQELNSFLDEPLYFKKTPSKQNNCFYLSIFLLSLAAMIFGFIFSIITK